MYFEALISVKCCPKLHIKQLRINLHYIFLKTHVLVLHAYCEIELGGRGVTDEKGGPGKGGSEPPDPPLLDTPMNIVKIITGNFTRSSVETYVFHE